MNLTSGAKALELALTSLENTLTDQKWAEYRKYLETTCSTKTISDRMVYSKRYAKVLLSGNAQDLLSLPPEKRKHVMKALANLSKFLGCYDYWKAIKERYQLKWDKPDSLAVFQQIYSQNSGYSSLLEWFLKARSKLPSSYGNVLTYNVLTGLRVEEACHSLALLRKNREEYLDREKMVIEHFKFPELFIHRTKKAYISIVTESILELAERDEPSHSYAAMLAKIRKSGLEVRMKACRKIFSTYLRMRGVEAEVIDLLQGRISQDVFVRHYFRPDFQKEIERIRSVLERLYAEIAV